MEFDELVRNLRCGNSAAVEQFISTYESYIRRTFRIRIQRANLSAVADSVDICQSVFGSFLIRLTAGEYELHSEQQLRNLLFTMARNKFALVVRREYAVRRDRNRHTNLDSGRIRLVPSKDNPQLTVERIDLIEQICIRLTPADRELFRLRQAGSTWDEIASRSGSSATQLRQRYSRAIHQVTIELGFEEPND